MKRALCLLVTTAACHFAAKPPPGPTLNVPLVDADLKFDGEADEPAWQRAARTGDFVDEQGALARPFSELKVMATKSALVFLLYAADQDIEMPKAPLAEAPLDPFDHFALELRRAADQKTIYELQIAPDGSVYDSKNGDAAWSSQLVRGVDKDGTANDPSDEDEEWVVEAALPFAAIGAKPGETLLLAARRCDTPKNSGPRCGGWSGILILP